MFPETRYKKRREALRQEHASYNVCLKQRAHLGCDASGSALALNQSVFDCGEALAEDVDEKILLHGTSWESANDIVQNGFDNRISHRCLYGDGVYFASEACKSHQYTCHLPGSTHRSGCNCRHERTLIIARVALGDPYLAREVAEHRPERRRPPVKSGKQGVTYDSIIVNPGPIRGHPQREQVHQEFVLFDREQAYPCFVVQYHL